MTQTLAQPLTVPDAITSRRSIRKFAEEPLDQNDLREIVRLAGLAPSAWNVQPWRFAVVQDPALKERLREAAYGQAQVTGAPAVIAVYSDMEDALANAEETAHPGRGDDGRAAQRKTFEGVFGPQTVEARGRWGLAQANIAFGFLLVAARGLGYDTSPMLGFDAARVRELLGLPEHVQFAGLVALGLRAEEGFAHHRHDVDRVATFY